MQLRFSDRQIDLQRRTIEGSGEADRLTSREAQVLVALAAEPELDAAALLKQVWGRRGPAALPTLHTTIRRLRLKIEPDPGRPQHLVRSKRGYRLVHENQATGPSLPQARDAFIGEQRAARLRAALDAHALVCVVGPPGVGKTRTVREALRAETGTVWWVDLACALTSSDLVRLVALVAGTDPPSGADPVATLGRRLAVGHPALLVLDTAEHLLDPIGRLLRPMQTGHCRVALTSRRRLSHPTHHITLGALQQDEAVALFLARVSATDVVVEASAGVRDLVTRLDRIPLAIELAAARAGTMSPAQMVARLDQPLRLLRDAADALRTAIAWSWDLLTEDERTCMAAFSAFRGGAGLADLCAVAPAGLDHAAVVDALVNHSLLTWTADEGQARLWSLATIQAFAEEQMSPAGRRALHQRHAAHFSRVATPLGEAARWNHASDGMASLLAEMANIDAAHARVHTQDPELGAALATALFPVYAHLDPLGGVGGALARTHAQATLLSPGTQARVLADWGHLCRILGRADEANAAIRGAMELARAHGLSQIAVDGLLEAASLAIDAGDLDAAQASLDEAVGFEAGLPSVARAHVQLHRATVAARRGDAHEAERICRSVLDITPAHLGLRMSAWGRLGDALCRLARLDEAEQAFTSALVCATSLGDSSSSATLQTRLGGLLLHQGRMEEARAHLTESEAIHRRQGNRLAVAICAAQRAHALLVLGELTAAAVAAEQAIDTLDDVGALVERSLIQLILSVIERARGRPEEALTLLQQAGSHLQGWKGAWAHAFRAATLAELGNPKAAEQAVCQARARSGQEATADALIQIACWEIRRVGGEPVDPEPLIADLEEVAATCKWTRLALGLVRRRQPV
jgi:predicted ATPase/predicted negative regulator of RcsB-dependent stress response